MKKALPAFLMSFVLAGMFSVSAAAQTASWRQVVGIIMINNVVGVGSATVTGGFLPWTTTSGNAHVNLQNGQIHFSVRGLVFAAGAPGITIGTPGPISGVKGVLVCNAAGTPDDQNSVIVETPSVPLSPTGDAEFNGNIGPLPSVCTSDPDIAFLVRASVIGGQAMEGPWIANGAVLSMNGDRNNGDGDNDKH